ncbi:MAG: helix-turn-helix domain-containing protein [Clostridiales bacterium]|nr:helix-turn-helix domain-containing protein [Clostridiales bacterium]
MTLAAAELRSSDIKIIDLALKYGYKNAESFSRAFTKFHGITPSKVRNTGVELKSFSRLMSYESIEGGNTVNYFFEEKGGFTLCGFKKRMHGVPYSVERYKQEKEFFRSAKMKQWIINGISSVCSDKFDSNAYYCVLDNFGDGGYEFFYAQPADSGFADNMSERDYASLKKLSITKITVPGGYYAVFKIDCEHYLSKSYLGLYKHIICEWAVSTNFQLANSPEIMICRCGKNESDNELIEIYIPLEMKSPKS